MVCEKLPSPLEMTSERAEKLLSLGTRQFNSLPEKTQELKEGSFPPTQHTQRSPVRFVLDKIMSCHSLDCELRLCLFL